MNTFKRALLFIFIYLVISIIITFAIYIFMKEPQAKGYGIGTLLSFLLSLLWILGARKGMQSNTLVLLSITVGGFMLRLILLGVFMAGGVYMFKMDLPTFAIAFLVGTLYSLILEVWFFATLSTPDNTKL
jgi:hypothetical protein